MFDLFGRRILVVKSAEGWDVFHLGPDGKRRRATDVVVPSDTAESGILGYLDDLYHEWASERHPNVRRLD